MVGARPALSGTERTVAFEVLRHGPLSRSELARRLGLSRASLTRLTRPLLDSGLLVETAGPNGAGGRPLDVIPTSHHFLGVKLTGDTAYGVVTTLRAQVVAAQEVPLASREPGDVVALVGELLDRLSAGLGSVTAVGVSLGGAVIDHDFVTSGPYLGWTDVPLGMLLRKAVGRPVAVDNDILSLTRAEQWFGAARGCDRFAVVTTGQGVGYGLVVHGRVVEGRDEPGGLIGHLPLDPFGPVCPLGHRGCAESLLTSDAVVRRASVALGRPVGYEQVLDLAEAGDPAARRVVDDSASALGRLVTLVGAIAMPRRVVLSGEGVRLVEVGRRAFDAAVGAGRDPRAEALRIDVESTAFTEWARGAAVTAIQDFMLGGPPPVV